MQTENVILVDSFDNPLGSHEKMDAHVKGLLHRAFSVFIFNKKGEMLLQQRALGKYHSGGLWTNACCSHPLPGEVTEEAVMRRLNEELGFQVSVEKIFDFVYNAKLENGLMEHEFDHVFVGEYDGEILFNTDEVMSCCYMEIPAIRLSLRETPEKFTAWFHIAFPEIEKWWAKTYQVKIAV
ncbi:isopentenyl-diphosphate delta-isomerase [Chitinophagaceae bacterium IBVUCB2]|nr:isopentenyl-diphosphate delta-isomerase [Chitinophagaceae bacterium IBVUCB2]